MTVILEPTLSAVGYPIGPETGAVYTLTTPGPTGGRAVFNDPNDPDYIGVLSDITGIDSADTREYAEDLTEFDGGIHGPFYHGRRPVTFSGQIVPNSVEDRNIKELKLQRATAALRVDATLAWTPTGGIPVYLTARRQQPPRITGAWVKDYQVALVAADPRVYSQLPKSASVAASGSSGGAGFSFDLGFDIDFGAAAAVAQVSCVNNGSGLAYPTITLTGPLVNPVVRNVTTGENISFVYTLGAGETLIIDTLNRTVLLNGSANRYSAVDFLNTTWWGLGPGTSDVRLQPFDYSAGASLKLDWRDTWL